MNGKRWFFGVGGTALVAAAAYVFLAPSVPEVKTETVAEAQAVRALAVNGRIRPRQSVDVRSPVSGTVLELPFDVGDTVSAGSLLARIDDGPQRAAIAEGTAAIAAQESTLAQARRDLARYQALGEFITRRQVEDAQTAVARATQELQRLRAGKQASEEAQQRFVIRAAFTGTIMDRPVDRGQTIGPDTTLYRLADLNNPEISADIDEAYAIELAPGTKATVKLAGLAKELRAEVSHIEPRVDEQTGAREARLRFLDPIDTPPAGQTVSINLLVEQRSKAISIPRAAILQADSAPKVYVVNGDGVIAEQSIRFIDWPAERVIVTQGLTPGMKLVLDPAATKPGDQAKPVQ